MTDAPTPERTTGFRNLASYIVSKFNTTEDYEKSLTTMKAVMCRSYPDFTTNGCFSEHMCSVVALACQQSMSRNVLRLQGDDDLMRCATDTLCHRYAAQDPHQGHRIIWHGWPPTSFHLLPATNTEHRFARRHGAHRHLQPCVEDMFESRLRLS